MTTERFRASAQYGDIRGTASADRADKADADQWLMDRGLKQDHEFLVGITMFAGENHGKHEDPIYVRFLLAERGDYDTVKTAIDASEGPFAVRCVRTEMPIADFLALFKRFSIYISAHALLDGKEYTHPDE